MEINKRKYKQKEVLDILTACKIEYEAKLAEQKSRIFELSEENSRLREVVGKYELQEKSLSSAVVDAEKTASEIREKAEIQYALEIERLKSFKKRWDTYFSELKEKYPLYAKLNEVYDIKSRLDEFLKNAPKKAGVEQLNEIIDGKKPFNPKEKIDNYIAATKDGGFNMEEVLNPGELRLEDLCKELGLID